MSGLGYSSSEEVTGYYVTSFFIFFIRGNIMNNEYKGYDVKYGWKGNVPDNDKPMVFPTEKEYDEYIKENKNKKIE